MTAKTAFLNIMKTWVGVFTLTSDDLALPFLMRMLRDAKVLNSLKLLCLFNILFRCRFHLERIISYWNVYLNC